MKIKATKKELDFALQIASIGVASGDDSDIRTHFLFRVKDGQVQVVSNNGNRTTASAVITGATVVDGQEGDSFTAPSWRVRKFVGLVKNDDEEITLSFADGLTKATCKRGTGKWGSLNPKDFRLTDKTFADAKKVTTAPLARLANILSYNRNFVSEQENKNPNLVATECRDGVFFATDSQGVSLVTSPVFANSSLRIHGKDIPAIITFLSIKGVEEVEVFEHENVMFFRRPDAVEGLLGVSRWTQEFPNLRLDKNEADKCWFSIDVEALKDAMEFLGAFAQKDDSQLRFRFEKDEVVVSMASGAGSDEDDNQVLPLIESEGMENLSAEGYTGFTLMKRFVEIAADTHLTDKKIRFGVNWVKKNGYVTLRREQNGDEFFTLIMWHRK
jgi:DNA polymerase III sliding clamp (beta) subunit (PCNA family)